jgi:hypothetical protein
MNNTTRTIIAAIGLLAIGFLAGYHTNRAMVKKKLDRVAKERISPGFVERMMDILDITEVQKPEVEPILKDFSVKLIEARKIEMERRGPILDSMYANLIELMDGEQKEKLNKMVERMKRSRHRSHKKGDAKKRVKQN